jgi:hypothetical protein
MSGYYDRRTRQWRNTGVSAYYGNALADFVKVILLFFAILAVLAAVALVLVLVGLVVFGLLCTLAGYAAGRPQLRRSLSSPVRRFGVEFSERPPWYRPAC